MDWLDPEAPAEWLADLLALIANTAHLRWLLLTKRPELWEERLNAVARYGNGKPPANVWMLTTCEDQAAADRRVPELLRIPALVRGLSCEPLLGPIDLRGWLHLAPCPQAPGAEAFRDMPCDCRVHRLKREHIGWVIAGGESGPNARPCHPDWVRGLRDQCQAAGVAFFYKQGSGHGRPGGKPEKMPLLDGKRWAEVPNAEG